MWAASRVGKINDIQVRIARVGSEVLLMSCLQLQN